MRIMCRRFAHRLVPADSDEVMFGVPIPAGGSLNNIWLNMKLVGPEETGVRTANIYGVSGFVIPIPDPDTQITYQTVWDRFIPKDVAGGSTQGFFDIDTVASDTTPEFEPGLVDWSGVFDLTALDPVEIFRRRKLITLADSAVGYQQKDSASDLFVPTDRFSSHIGRRVKVNMPSVCLIAVSSPQTTTTQTTEFQTPTEGQWSIMQHMERVLEDMVYFGIGFVEAGAETPYDLASDFLESLLEEVYFEETAALINPVTWDVHSWVTFDISMPGRRSPKTLTSE